MKDLNKEAEPPSRLRLPGFMIGRDGKGCWVAQSQDGTCGGLFVDRAQALKFARFESGNRRPIVVLAAGLFELDMSKPSALPRRRLAA
jgi:hypothetical protein